ncbi:hypothetical protein [Bradyrhizobium neotropicale]|uniref:Uncharacterized protein n=1 Tax=Bradyrhizobium neotropicale TaxID=1497615 RepID=A0A176ZB46_9BRAD|nr:hypothetical protein [Bradyrhizobium neotropicale]OAF17861.1 hypothetical protein AXW67_06995 [Bradyrhizobium neotropicale]
MSNAIRFPDSNDRDRRDAGAYRQMEGDLQDLVSMGRIAAQLAQETDGDPPVCEARNLALFAVFHLQEMLLRFAAKYENRDWSAGEEAS